MRDITCAAIFGEVGGLICWKHVQQVSGAKIYNVDKNSYDDFCYYMDYLFQTNGQLYIETMFRLQLLRAEREAQWAS